MPMLLVMYFWLGIINVPAPCQEGKVAFYIKWRPEKMNIEVVYGLFDWES